MDAWFTTWARWIKRHEAALFRAEQVCALEIDVHHLYYLLVRCEGLGFDVGPLDVPCTPRRSLPGVVSTGIPHSDAYSIASIQQTIQSSVSTWWGGTIDAPDPDRLYAYLYSVLSRVSSLRITPPPTSVHSAFADFPGEHATPLFVCKGIRHLALDGVDPASIVGWDRLSIQLTSLVCTHISMADVTDLFVGLVLRDAHIESLPAAAWHALQYACLAYNELTFIPSSMTTILPSLRYLDVSHNLLNAVPPALESLDQLQALNVSGNMIDSVLGIYLSLPHIRILNLGGNRLESLCGVERLHTLEQIDLRTNMIQDPGEVGRLATLPQISHVWIHSNPLLTTHPDARVACFYFFALEHKHVVLDDAPCGFFERRRVSSMLAQRVAMQPQRDSAVIEARYAPKVRHVTTSPTITSTERRKKSHPKTPTRRPEAAATFDTYKQRMEQLRDHMGDDWLRVVAKGDSDPFRVHAPCEDAPILTFPWPIRLFIETVSTPVGAACVSAGTIAGSFLIWRRFFRRIPNASYITPSILRSRRRIVGRVTSVGDADGFRMYHTPGIPFLRQRWHRPPTKASDLRHQTISVRLAGVDAPEAAHFGREAQPYADVAHKELRRLLEGRTVWLDMALIDQYQRLVGTPYVYRWPYLWPTNVSLALVRKGLATVYRSTNATYGPPSLLSRLLFGATSGRKALERAEEHAKRCRLGMWRLGSKLETPGAFKFRTTHHRS